MDHANFRSSSVVDDTVTTPAIDDISALLSTTIAEGLHGAPPQGRCHQCHHILLLTIPTPHVVASIRPSQCLRIHCSDSQKVNW